ncbi:5'-nucleotidase C-terminal domain-containing protein [Trueperella sp. LYQ143]|uniref:bifunctional metallophosphatase/5'-nucleotidase n=1 Tax=Trueperella sp. LYQ143 TaxID=3391059 RepID=UPI003982F986
MKRLWSTMTVAFAATLLPLSAFAASPEPSAGTASPTDPAPTSATDLTTRSTPVALAANDNNPTPDALRAADASVDVLAIQDAHEVEQRTWKDGSKHGGLAQLATVLAAQRAASANTITAFGGDLAGGTLFGAVYRGEPFVDAFNELKFDVAGFGQHDFDFGLDHTMSLIERAKFPWISSNLTANGKPLSPDGTVAIVDRGLRVGFLSITGNMTTTAASAQVQERDWVQASKEAAAALTAQGADVIIALTQLSNDETQAIMREVPQIHAAVTEETSGSSPATLTQVDGRPILTPEADYGTVARLHIVRSAGKISVEPSFIPVDGNVTPDSVWSAKTQQYMDELNQRLSEKLGVAPQDMARDVVGPIVAQAYREHEGADFGWQNGGGIRAEIPAGDVTKRTVLSVLPFANSVITIRTNGEHLRTALEQAIASDPKGNRGFPRLAGLRATIDLTAPEGHRVTALTTEDGTPISPIGSYTIALTRYVYQGGDKVTAFRGDEIVSADPVLDAEAFEAYVRRHGTLVPLDNNAKPTPAPAPSPVNPQPEKPSNPAPNPMTPGTPGPRGSSLAATGLAGGELLVGLALVAIGGGLLLMRRYRTY